MTKNDLLEVGTRLIGLYYLTQGISTLAYIHWVSRMMGRDGMGGFSGDSTLSALLAIGLGGGLFLWSPRLVAWISRRDAARTTP